MKLALKLLVMFILLAVKPQQANASSLVGDSTLYRQVVDSLIRIAVKAGQLHPIVFISKSKQLKVNKSIGDGNVGLIVRQYAEDSINYNRHDESLKVQSNRQLRNALLRIEQFKRRQAPLPALHSAAQLRYKHNGCALFKSSGGVNRYREKHPEFFCVADITEPVYAGSYAVVIVDRQFNPLGGGGYMHIFQKVNGSWQTYAIVDLWNY